MLTRRQTMLTKAAPEIVDLTSEGDEMEIVELPQTIRISKSEAEGPKKPEPPSTSRRKLRAARRRSPSVVVLEQNDDAMEGVQEIRVDEIQAVELGDEVVQVEEVEGLELPLVMADEEYERELEEFRSEMSRSEEIPHYSADAGSTVLVTSSLERDIRRDLPKYYGQECFVCHLLDGEMQTCTAPKCLARFHPDCNDPALLGEFQPYVRPQRTQCRQHHCTTCFAENLRFTAFRSLPDEEIFRCVYCTNAYHKGCSPAENVCFYCLNNWSPRKGQLCHVFNENRFVPAEVAKTDWAEAFNIRGLVPVFPLGCGKRDSSTLLQIPACFLVPMIAYESMRNYYEQHLDEGILGRYLQLLEKVTNEPYYLLPRPGRQKPQFNNEKTNTMTLAIRRDLQENYDELAENCKCVENADKVKCFSDECLNRHLGYECRDSCGETCMNRAKAREVTDCVEIFEAPFGGFGLRATRVIKAGHPIGEYTGTIIEKEKTKTLLRNYVTRRNQEQPLYLMAIDNAFNIDAARTGRATRFANHSCDPNTEVARVLGTDNLPHQMLYAKREIKAGEPITFDYNFTWTTFNPRCYCGTSACTGHFSGRLKKKLLVEPKPDAKPNVKPKVAKQEPRVKRELEVEGTPKRRRRTRRTAPSRRRPRLVARVSPAASGTRIPPIVPSRTAGCSPPFSKPLLHLI
ncbi:SET domain-containing protein [Aphelenchoides fujianensis]|nr:SET domain-containing protein [Aphelenchoides fujianensis]